MGAGFRRTSGHLGDVARVVCLAVWCLTGCSAEYWTGRIEPETVFKINPLSHTVTFRDTKQNTVRIKGLQVNTNGDKSMSVDEVEVLNLSEPVIAADAARMQYVIEGQRVQVEYQRQIGQNIAMAIAAGGDAAAKFISTLPKIEAGWSPTTGLSASMQPAAPCPLSNLGTNG